MYLSSFYMYVLEQVLVTQRRIITDQKIDNEPLRSQKSRLLLVSWTIWSDSLKKGLFSLICDRSCVERDIFDKLEQIEVKSEVMKIEIQACAW